MKNAIATARAPVVATKVPSMLRSAGFAEIAIVALCAVPIWSCAPALAADEPAEAETEEGSGFDVTVETTFYSDYMDSGLTESDHHPSLETRITASYDLFYASVEGYTLDYGTDDPWASVTYTVGVTPSFGDLSLDVSLARRIKYDDPSSDRWLPYVTGTYTFDERFQASLGAGYYAHDDVDCTDFAEIYAAATYTHESGAFVTGEAYFEPRTNDDGDDYYGFYGTVGVPVPRMEALTANAELGYEWYQNDPSIASYTWWDVNLTYAFNDNVSVVVGYQDNDLSAAGCSSQAYTDCDGAVYAKLMLSTKLSDWTAPKR